MNSFKGIGRLVRNPELKFIPDNGTAVCNFILAIDTGYGERRETAFIPVVVWGKSAEAVANYTTKGSKIAVSGRISTRSYEAKDGSKKYITEIVTDMYGGVEFLDNKSNSIENRNGDIDKDITPIEGEDIPF